MPTSSIPSLKDENCDGMSPDPSLEGLPDRRYLLTASNVKLNQPTSIRHPKMSVFFRLRFGFNLCGSHEH